MSIQIITGMTREHRCSELVTPWVADGSVLLTGDLVCWTSALADARRDDDS